MQGPQYSSVPWNALKLYETEQLEFFMHKYQVLLHQKLLCFAQDSKGNITPSPQGSPCACTLSPMIWIVPPPPPSPWKKNWLNIYDATFKQLITSQQLPVHAFHVFQPSEWRGKGTPTWGYGGISSSTRALRGMEKWENILMHGV